MHTLCTFITPDNRTAKPIKWSYTVDHLKHKLGMDERWPVLTTSATLQTVGACSSAAQPRAKQFKEAQQHHVGDDHPEG